QGIACMNNSRQLGLAWLMYTQDSDDRVPPNLVLQAGASGVGKTYVSGVLNMANSADNTDSSLLQQSLLTAYCPNLGVWHCAGDKSVSTGNGGPTPFASAGSGGTVPRVRSISMNCWLYTGRLSVSPGFRVIKKVADMSNPGPAMTWLMMDEREDSIDDGYFAVDMTGYPDNPRNIVWANYPASYHNNSAGISFGDGHAETKRWRDPRTRPTLVPGTRMPLNVASPNNEDLVWLQQRTTGKE
ncbi:MAG: xcpT 2, partial [Pedosphaera sp.]|nr:xcpT 2 [Pedosphaera sp.]